MKITASISDTLEHYAPTDIDPGSYVTVWEDGGTWAQLTYDTLRVADPEGEVLAEWDRESGRWHMRLGPFRGRSATDLVVEVAP